MPNSNLVKSHSLILSIVILTFLLTLSPQLSRADCFTCAVRNGMSYCAGGSIATGCRATPQGCTFSGSWECGEGGCFLPETRIMTRRGVVPIDRIRSGDQVLSLQEDGSELWVPVKSTRRALRVGYLVINSHLSVTGDHPFLCQGQWKRADELKAGDFLTGGKGQPVAIESLEFVDAGVRVFNLDVLSPDTFIAGGFLVHNKEKMAYRR